MAVTVRLFAALRDAAGTASIHVEPGPLPAVVDGLCARFGEPFTTRVTVASGMLDGQRVALDDDVVVPDGAELALLPPFSGGAEIAAHDGHGDRRLLVGAVLLPLALALAAVTARWVFGVAVVAVAVAGLIDLHGRLGATDVRTLLPAALAVGVGPPLAVLAAPADPVVWVSPVLAVTVMACFALAFMTPRRHESASIVGATLLAGLLVGAGGACLLLLRDAVDVGVGLTTLVLVASADAAVILTQAPQDAATTRRPLIAAAIAALGVSTIALTVGTADAGVALVLTLAAAAVVTAIATARLHDLLRGEGNDALTIGIADAVLLTAPIALVVVQLFGVWRG